MTMNMLKRTITASILFGAAGVAAFPVFSYAGEPKRGEFPVCQEECLKKHKQLLDQAWDEYKKTNDRASYQDSIETAGDEYTTCLNRCRVPISVK
jgi:hypothetical protein